MDLNVLLEREVAGDEERDALDAIRESTSIAALFRVAVHAKGARWRMEAAERLASDGFEGTQMLRATLRQIAHLTDDDAVRRTVLDRATALERGEGAGGGVDFGKSVLNPDLPKWLLTHRGELDPTDECDLDLIELVAWQRDSPGSSMTRRIAERMYGMLPKERQDVIDGKVNEYYGWDRSANRYFLMRRLIEDETDVDKLEATVLGDLGDAWVWNFALARLTGWSTYQEEDFWSFLTFECEQLGDYPAERLDALLAKAVARGRISQAKADRLLGKAADGEA